MLLSDDMKRRLYCTNKQIAKNNNIPLLVDLGSGSIADFKSEGILTITKIYYY